MRDPLEVVQEAANSGFFDTARNVFTRVYDADLTAGIWIEHEERPSSVVGNAEISSPSGGSNARPSSAENVNLPVLLAQLQLENNTLRQRIRQVEMGPSVAGLGWNSSGSGVPFGRISLMRVNGDGSREVVPETEPVPDPPSPLRLRRIII